MTRLILLLIVIASCQSVWAADLEQGKQVYEKNCAWCHGVTGDGKGDGATRFLPRPRDFTSGKYKIRHTKNGELPTDQDLHNAIRKGLAFQGYGAYTGMPPWPNLSDEETTSLVAYIKSFAPGFKDEKLNKPAEIQIPSFGKASEESIKKGREVFEKNECIKCHGTYGRSNGRSAPTLKDEWDNRVRPADLSKRWTFRGGGAKEDIFRTISTGFNGTPMPSYIDTVSEEDRVHLVNYIYSLSDRDTPAYNSADKPIMVNPTETSFDKLELAEFKKLFETAQTGIVPIVGQIIEPGRRFYPSVNELQVKALYNKDQIAIMLQWNDISADKGGTNAPDTAVTEEQPKEEKPAAENSDPFGESAGGEEDPFASESEEGPAYSDAVAVQLPLKLQEGFKKPYFIFGDSASPVQLWFTDLAKTEASLYTGKGSSQLTKAGESGLRVLSGYDEGEWTAIFVRSRKVTEGVSFDLEKSFVPVAFSVWDGLEGERGNQRGLSTWFSLYLKPFEEPSAVGPSIKSGVLFLLVELAIIFLVRRRRRV